MKITTEELERCETLLTLEVEPSEEQELLKKAARRIAQQVKIPGFRPGKAPYNTVVRRFGLEAIQHEILEDNSLEKMVREALTETNLTPYTQVRLDNVSWDPLVLKIKVPTHPIVELGNYRDTRLEPKPVEVSDEDVEKTLKAIQDQHAVWVPVERAAEMGDLVSMAVVEKAGEETLAEQESVDYELVTPEEGSQQPDLATHLVGLKAGDETTFTVTYPEGFSDKNYAGKEVTFTVDISAVKAKEVDSLDDDFARRVDDVQTLAELKERIRENMLRQRQQQADYELGHEALDQIVENAEKVEWPLAMEDESIERELDGLADRLKRSGLTLDSYLQMSNKSREDLGEEIRGELAGRLKRGLVLGKIAEEEKLQVTNSEILQQAKTIADYSGGGEQVWRNILTSEEHQGIIANDLLSSKVIYRLAAIAKGEAPSLEEAPEAEAAGSAEGEPAAEGEASTGSDDAKPEDQATGEPITAEA